MGEGVLPLLEVQNRLRYHFLQPDLLELALTHPSYAHEHPEEGGAEFHNQRLEFLGDAVLDFLVAAWLYQTYPDFSEGPLTRLRATLVCTTTLASLAQRLGLGEALRLGRGEEESGGNARVANLCDALEALVGALYLDGGLETVWEHMEPWFAREAEAILHAETYVDAKSRFQEWAQAERGVTPAYHIVGEEGPEHAKVFTAQAVLKTEVVGEGQGSSKRLAEQAAARSAIATLMREEQLTDK
ncbi:MAG TPA: ribonuclease III [Anaerolineae bacterium]|nr:ribonuclease III [Anaerolineae bacterium]HQH39289.1 ribonuclease III [Anaerolineae bacterium]